MLYAAESMRLTHAPDADGLLASLQRAVNNGEMSRDQVIPKRARSALTVSTSTVPRRLERSAGSLPRPRRARSLRLQNRIALLDREIYRPSEEEFKPDNENSVQAQLNLLRTAFNAG